MKLQLRQKSKREQTLDAFASVAKTWSEWHLGKKVSTTAAKGAKQAAKVKGSGKATKLKIAGAVAVVGAAGAAGAGCPKVSSRTDFGTWARVDII